jgi:hypothetical protein
MIRVDDLYPLGPSEPVCEIKSSQWVARKAG